MGFRKTIGDTIIEVVIADLTTIKADAYLVPQFEDEGSFGGVAAAIAKAGGLDGLRAYNALVRAAGTLSFGEAFLTKSGGGNSQYHLHTVTVMSGPQHEFSIVRNGVYHALALAAENNLRRLVSPVLGTGIAGCLSNLQAGKAMFSGVARYMRHQPASSFNFTVAIRDDGAAVDMARDLQQVLETNAYDNEDHEVGERVIHPDVWRAQRGRPA